MANFTVYDKLLNRCNIDSKKRKLKYEIGDNSGILTPQTRGSIQIKNDYVADFDKHYCTFNLHLTNTTPAVTTKYVIRCTSQINDVTTNPPNRLIFLYMGDTIDVDLTVGTSNIVNEFKNKFNRNRFIGPRGYELINVLWPSYPAITQGTDAITLEFSGSERTGETFEGYEQTTLLTIVSSIISNLESSAFLCKLSQSGSLQYPRYDKHQPLFDEVSIDFGSNNTIKITDYAVLSAIHEVMEPLTDIQGNGVYSQELEYGSSWIGGKPYKINFSCIDLLNKIIPLKFTDQKFYIRLRTNSANQALIQKTANSTGSFEIRDLTFYFHDYEISESESAMLRDEINKGLYIPFKNWDCNKSETEITEGIKQATIKFNSSWSSLLGAFCVMIPVERLYDVTQSRKFSEFVRCGSERYRYRIGAEFYPEDYISVNLDNPTKLIQAYEHFAELADIVTGSVEYNKNKYCLINYYGGEEGNYKTVDLDKELAYHPVRYNIDVGKYKPYFIRGYTFTKIPFSENKSICKHSYISGLDVSRISQLYLQFDNLTVNTDMICYIYCYIQQALLLTPNTVKVVA